MQNAGYAALQIIPSFEGFEGHLERGTRGGLTAAGTKGGVAYGDAAGKSAGSRFNRIFVGAAKLGLAGAVGAGVAAFKLGKDAISQASDLNESLNAVNVTYGKQAAAVKKLGTDAADALGLSNTEFNGLAVQFSAFATQVAGGEGPKVIGVLDQLTTRGADFASVMNLEVNEALGLFQSGLAGETEPLRKFGIDLSAAKVEAFALAEGIAKPTKNLLEIKAAQLDVADAQSAYTAAMKDHGKESTEAQRAALGLKDAQNDLNEATKGNVSELTEAEKVQARYKLLMEQTSKTHGDFANTSDSLANSQRRLSARWDNAQAKLGTALLPVMEDLVGLILKEGIPAVERFGDWFAENGIGHLEKFGGYAKDAAGFVKDLVGFINDIPNAGKLAGLATVLGGGAALKLRGGGLGGGGTLGAVGSALGIAKPVPVFVTNPGGLGGGIGAGGKGGKIPPAAAIGTGALLAGGAALTAGTIFNDPKVLNEQVGWPKAKQEELRQAIAEMQAAGKDVSELIKGYEESYGISFDNLSVAARNALDATAAEFKRAKIPTELRTDIALNGVPKSMGEARSLVKQYDLTPKQVRTLFDLMGYEISKKQARDLQQQYAQTPAEKRTRFTLDSGGLSAEIARINRDLDYASRDRRTQITIAYARAGRNTVGGLQEANGGIVEAFADGGFSSTGQFVQKVPQLRRGGGAVVWNEPETGWEAYISGKPGMRSRNIAILAEASRRLGVQQFADGGMAGRASPPRVSVGGSSVQVFIDGREIRGIAVREANRVLNAQQSHDDLMREPR